MKAAVAQSNRAITLGSVFKHTCSFIVFGSYLCGRISYGCLSGLGLGSVMQQQTIKQAKQALHNKAIKNRPQAGWTRRYAPRLLWRRYRLKGC
jgi:chorismate-pyruvate lyase